MKTIFTRFFLFSIISLLSLSYGKAQTGLDSLIVERYYVSNADDSIGSIGNGNLPVGSVTYRVFVDMKQGYKFQMAYGDIHHPLSITTSTSFFNNEDRGSTNPTYTKNQAKNNTVMLDSWLSVGAACVGNFGILKSEDDGGANIINADGILQNADTSCGIALTVQDGFIAGTPGSFGTLGIDSIISVFDATSQLGNTFETTNGAWFCLSGAVGPDTTNKVLIAQITTDGQLKFKLNIQLGTPTGGIEKYVASNPIGSEVQRDYLIFDSDSIYIIDTTHPGIVTVKSDISFSVYPNPSNGVFTLSISGKKQNSNNYYTVYNLLGKKLFSKDIPAASINYKENIDLSSFENGIYFIEIWMNGNRTTKKLIKN